MNWIEADLGWGQPVGVRFYHSIELPISGPQTGSWDLIGRFDDYIGHQDLDGKTVLDVGTASGFLSFEAERRGARVSSFDVAVQASTTSCRSRPGLRGEPCCVAGRSRQFVDRLRNSYWLCHEEFGSAARCFYGDVYDLDDAGYDVVILGRSSCIFATDSPRSRRPREFAPRPSSSSKAALPESTPR